MKVLLNPTVLPKGPDKKSSHQFWRQREGREAKGEGEVRQGWAQGARQERAGGIFWQAGRQHAMFDKAGLVQKLYKNLYRVCFALVRGKPSN